LDPDPCEHPVLCLWVARPGARLVDFDDEGSSRRILIEEE
jgi:hypothetical protein